MTNVQNNIKYDETQLYFIIFMKLLIFSKKN